MAKMKSSGDGSSDGPAPEHEGPKTDVSQIERADLETKDFPASLAGDYRVVISGGASDGVCEHSKSDTSVEQCGVLAGRVLVDGRGPYLLVEEIIEGVSTRRSGSQVTFTHETWEHVHSAMAESFPELRIVGWYHSHPGLGVFLSDMDQFIQDNFFNAPHSVAFVYDPVSEEQAVFFWRKGQSERLRRYWVGDELRYDLDPASAGPAKESKPEGGEPQEERLYRPAPVGSGAGDSEDIRGRLAWVATAALSLFAAFALGSYITSYAVRREMRDHQESMKAVIQTGLFRDGLPATLTGVEQRLGLLAEQVTQTRIRLGRVSPEGWPVAKGDALSQLDDAARTARSARMELGKVAAVYSATDLWARKMKVTAMLPDEVDALKATTRGHAEMLAGICVTEARKLLSGGDPATARQRKQQATVYYRRARALAPWLSAGIDEMLPELAPKRRPRATTEPAAKRQGGQ